MKNGIKAAKIKIGEKTAIAVVLVIYSLGGGCVTFRLGNLKAEALRCFELQKYERAAKKFREITVIAPDDAESLLLLGWCRYYEGRMDKAVESFESLLNRFPKVEESRRVSCLQGLTLAHYYRQNYQKVLRVAGKALSLNASWVNGYLLKGWSFFYLGSYDMAEREFEKAKELNASLYEADRGIGLCAYYQGDYEHARIMLKTALDRCEETANPVEKRAVLSELGWACLKADRLQDAEFYLKECGGDAPFSFNVKLGLAYVALEQGRYEKSRELFDELLELFPESPIILEGKNRIEEEKNIKSETN